LNKHFKIALSLLVLGVLALVGAKVFLPDVYENLQIDSSDAASTKGTIRIGMDNWVGYIPLCSSYMKKTMRRRGYILECINDNADYQDRFSNVKNGKYDFAVATVDSYIINASKMNFPGTIISVIDESKGGDAIVAWEKSASSIEDLKKKNDLKVAFTPDSPSSYLLKAVGSHFDVPMFKEHSGFWQKETDGSSAALKLFLNKKVDMAVLWEPDVSKALSKKGVKKILGTEDTSKLIVDILIANRSISKNSPEMVEALLENYFKTLRFYRQDEDALIKEIKTQTDVNSAQAAKLLHSVSWASLAENGLSWFGISYADQQAQEGLVETIESTIDILNDSGDLKSNPLPDHNPYRITNSSFVADLYEKAMNIGFGNKNATVADDSLTREFSALSTRSWKGLREIGTLKIRPISFQSGTSILSDEGKEELDKALEQLKHYPNFRIVIKGHTGIRGDKKTNQRLSLDRSESVSLYMKDIYGLNSNRIRVLGFGGTAPLRKNAGESYRSYNYRLPRVELSLVAELL